MKKLLSGMIYLLTICISCSNNQQTLVKDQKKDTYNLEIYPSNIDIGNVHKGTDKRICRDVILKNKGKIPIVIQKIDVSCGCLYASLSSKNILPNHSQKLSVCIDLNKQEGIINKTIFINSNANNRLEIIRVKGIINH